MYRNRKQVTQEIKVRGKRKKMKTKETHLLTCKEFKRNNASERNAKER